MVSVIHADSPAPPPLPLLNISCTNDKTAAVAYTKRTYIPLPSPIPSYMLANVGELIRQEGAFVHNAFHSRRPMNRHLLLRNLDATITPATVQPVASTDI